MDDGPARIALVSVLTGTCADCGAACPSTQWCCDACIREHNAECQRLGGFKHLGNGFEDDHGEDSYFESQMASGERDRWGRR